MLLVMDVGNTNIKLGGFLDDQLLFLSRVRTDPRKSADEYAVLFEQILSLYHANENKVEGCAISCVVPSLNRTLCEAVQKAFGCAALLVGAGVKTGLNIRIENPAALGSDFVCGAVGSLAKYPTPTMLISLGSAITFSALDQKGNFLGGSIMPGIDISLAALAEKTAQLPYIGLNPPQNAICGGTVDSMNAGVVYGYAAALDGMIDRYAKELGEMPTVVATGGRARFILPHCTHKIIEDDNLILDGLRLVWKKNKGKK